MSKCLVQCRGFVQLALSFVLLSLAACSQNNQTTRPDAGIDPQQLWLKHQQQLSGLDIWQLNGRIGLRTDQEGWSATLIWQQQQQNYLIRVVAPLGQGTYQIRQQDQQFSLLTPDNELFEAETAESFMLQQLGWSLPVAALRYWLVGLPYPQLAIDSQQLDAYGRLQQIQQSGWRIRYRAYHEQDPIMLPRKLIIENSEVRASILAKQWDLTP